jgi:hypothetical protein
MVEDLGQDNAADWERTNQGSNDGSIYHSLRWKNVLERSFGIKSHYFIVYDGTQPAALCPFFEEPLRGLRSLVPPPSTDLDHVIVTDPSNKPVLNEILSRSIDMAKRDRLAFIIMTCSKADVAGSIQGFGSVGHKRIYPFPTNGYLSLDLGECPPAHIWEKVFSSKDSQKKYIRRFEEAGYGFRDSKEKKEVDVFYEYYASNLTHIGAAPFDRHHFDVVLDTMQKEEVRLTLLEKGDEIAGGIMALLWPEKKEMYLRYMALNRNLPSTFHPPYALYWEAINYAAQNGYSKICFGTNTGNPADRSLKIKTGFGCRYHDNYSVLLPMNRLYRTAFWAYGHFRRGADQ